jgi:PAS domain S-box-containing protein
MNLGLIEVDENEVITLANQSFSDISGYGSEELIGQKHLNYWCRRKVKMK